MPSTLLLLLAFANSVYAYQIEGRRQSTNVVDVRGVSGSEDSSTTDFAAAISDFRSFGKQPAWKATTCSARNAIKPAVDRLNGSLEKKSAVASAIYAPATPLANVSNMMVLKGKDQSMVDACQGAYVKKIEANREAATQYRQSAKALADRYHGEMNYARKIRQQVVGVSFAGCDPKLKDATLDRLYALNDSYRKLAEYLAGRAAAMEAEIPGLEAKRVNCK